MRHLIFGLCLFSLALLPAVSVGNGPPPPAAWRYLRQPDKKGKDDDKAPAGKEVRVVENAPVSVTYRLDVTRPKIVIPQKFALVEGKPGAAPKAEADPPASRHLFAGLALSGAFVSGGFWLVRRSGKAGKALLVLLFVSGVAFCSALLSEVSGNIGPPARRPMTALETGVNTAKLGMDIVIVAEGERVEILLPKSLLPVAMIPAEILNEPPGRLFLNPSPPLKKEPKKSEE